MNKDLEGALFRDYLMQDDSTYYIFEGGVLSTTATPTPIYAAKGWDGLRLSWNRDMKLNGVFGTLSESQSYAYDGKAILHALNEISSTEAICYFRRDIRNPNDYDYQTMFYGQIDFGKSKQDKIYFIAPTIMGGTASLLDALGDTEREIPLDPSDPDLIYVNMDGIFVQEKVNYLPLGNDISSPYITGQEPAFVIPGWVFTDKEGSQQDGLGQTQSSFKVNSTLIAVGAQFTGPLGSTNMPLWVATKAATNAYFTWVQQVTVQTFTGGANVQFYIVVTGADGKTKVAEALDAIGPPPGTPPGTGYTTTVLLSGTTLNFSLDVNDRVYLGFYALVPAGNTVFVAFTPNPDDAVVYSGSLNFQTRTLPSVVPAFRYVDVLKKLYAYVLQPGATFNSSFFDEGAHPFLDSLPYNMVLTSGDGVRGLTGAVIKTSINECEKNLFAIHACGRSIDVDENISIMTLSDMYDGNTDILVIDNVTSAAIERTPAMEYKYRNTTNGYQVKTEDKLNGKDAFNTTQKRLYPNLAQDLKDEDNTAPYITDQYAIEELRANLSDKKTTDSSSDNDTILLGINNKTVTITTYLIGGIIPSGSITAWKLNRIDLTAGGTSSGTLFPQTDYNVEFSPARNFRRLAPLHAISVYKQPDKFINFQTTDQNRNLVSMFPGSVEITEAADIGTNELLDQLLFQPENLEFSTSTGFPAHQLIAANPFGYVTVNYEGNTYRAFLGSIEIDPEKEGAMQWKMLPTPDTDLSPLNS